MPRLAFDLQDANGVAEARVIAIVAAGLNEPLKDEVVDGADPLGQLAALLHDPRRHLAQDGLGAQNRLEGILVATFLPLLATLPGVATPRRAA